MENKRKGIGIIGVGNMGQALLDGVLKSEAVDKSDIYIYDSNKEKVSEVAKKYGVTVSDNKKIASQCSLCLIAVKPDKASDVLAEIGKYIGDDTLILSIVAGLTTTAAENILGGKRKFIRAMPNMSVQVGEGATAISAGRYASQKDMDFVMKILSRTGRVWVLNENKMDAVTGLSGSGPAYIFQIIEAMSDGGVFEGLPRDKALEIAAQTVLGAAKTVLETGLHPAVLKDMVTSPGGTTIEGIMSMERAGVRKAMMEAVIASSEKSKKLNEKK